MAFGLIGLYGIYFILVGVKGNAGKMVANVQADGKGFMPWLLAIIILRAMYNVETLRPFVKPFIGLAVLTFTLKNFNTVAAQVNTLLPSNAQIPIK